MSRSPPISSPPPEEHWTLVQGKNQKKGVGEQAELLLPPIMTERTTRRKRAAAVGGGEEGTVQPSHVNEKEAAHAVGRRMSPRFAALAKEAEEPMHHTSSLQVDDLSHGETSSNVDLGLPQDLQGLDLDKDDLLYDLEDDCHSNHSSHTTLQSAQVVEDDDDQKKKPKKGKKSRKKKKDDDPSGEGGDTQVDSH